MTDRLAWVRAHDLRNEEKPGEAVCRLHDRLRKLAVDAVAFSIPERGSRFGGPGRRPAACSSRPSSLCQRSSS